MNPLELAVTRNVKTDLSSIGKMTVDGKFLCLSLEDKDRDLVQSMPAEQIAKVKVFGKTAIPRGRYQVILSYSNRFKRILPEIIGVPGYVGTRIHPGNKPEDTEGCILTGTTSAANWVSASKMAFDRLMAHLQPAFNQGQQVFITIA